MSSTLDFDVGSTTAITIVNAGWDAEEFSFHLVPMMSRFAAGAGGVSKEDAKGWLAEMLHHGCIRHTQVRRSGLQSRRNPCVVIASPDGAVVNSARSADPELD
jgi:hypothetical protein